MFDTISWPDSWFFKQRNAAEAVYDHTYKELVFFKAQLEADRT